MGHRIFFSYGHDENAWIVDRLRADLEARGHEVWIDHSRIKAGDDWRRSITEGIHHAETVVGFLSQHSVRLPGVCLDELRIALCVRDGRIASVLVEPESDVTVPSSLSHVQWLDMSAWRTLRDASESDFDDWYRACLAELERIIDDAGGDGFAGDVVTLRGRLDPHLSDVKERELLSQPYTGRTWLTDEVERWRADADGPRAMLLVAGPGIGKSAFAAQQLHFNHHVIGGIFCEWSSPRLRDARVLIRTIAFKLACRLPDYRVALLSTIAETSAQDIAALAVHDAFDRLIAYPLSQVIDGGRERMIFVIDGLDEAGENLSNSLAAVLADSIERLPRWIGFLITARPEHSVLVAFTRLSPFRISGDDPRNLDDLCVFLQEGLLPALAGRPDQQRVLDELVEHAQGSFLWALLLIEAVRGGTLSLDDPSAYPRGIDGFYAQWFDRRVGHAETAAVRDFLEAVTGAGELPDELLDEVVGDRYAVQNARLALGSLVLETTRATSAGNVPTTTLCHKSLSDWLSDPTRSGPAFVDGRRGAKRVAVTASQLVLDGEGDDALQHVLRDRLVDWHAAGRAWRDLERFLLARGVPLDPYWRQLDRFPPSFDDGPLIDRLWASPHRSEFFATLQREGDARTLGHLLHRLRERQGFEALGSDTAGQLIDAVHISGDYPGAVTLCDEYLTAFGADDPGRANIRVRRLHHSMFFAPVEPLVDQAIALLTDISPTAQPSQYNELLFLIGGNLGLLSGDVERAAQWLDASARFADENALHDFRVRTARKQVDLLAITGDLQASFALADRMLVATGETSRYDLYLWGAWAETARALGDTRRAALRLIELERETVRRGLPGWRAHVSLGLAAVMLDEGSPEEARTLVADARERYERIHQRWGEVACDLLESVILWSAGDDAAAMIANRGADVADTLGYRYEAALLHRVAAGQTPPAFRLLFL